MHPDLAALSDELEALSQEWAEVEAAFAAHWAEQGPAEHIHETFYREEALQYVRREWEALPERPRTAAWC